VSTRSAPNRLPHARTVLVAASAEYVEGAPGRALFVIRMIPVTLRSSTDGTRRVPAEIDVLSLNVTLATLRNLTVDLLTAPFNVLLFCTFQSCRGEVLGPHKQSHG
jgi:hypothetical protein